MAGTGRDIVMSAHGFSIYQIAGDLRRQPGDQGAGAQPDRRRGRACWPRCRPSTRLVFLANPNNPTGTMLPYEEVARLRAGLPPDVLLVLDAAYAEYVDPAGLRRRARGWWMPATTR